jgi:hypothetical protein
LSFCWPLDFRSAQASGIKSRIALWGNPVFGSGQAADNIPLISRDDALTKHARVSVTRSNNVKRQCPASFGKFVLIFLKALEDIIRLHGDAAALLFDCFTARDRGSGSFRTVLRLGNADLSAKNQDGHK